MKKEISLVPKEIKEIYEITQKLYGKEENLLVFGTVDITTESNEIGTITKATFENIVHEGLIGDFTVTITDVEDW